MGYQNFVVINKIHHLKKYVYDKHQPAWKITKKASIFLKLFSNIYQHSHFRLNLSKVFLSLLFLCYYCGIINIFENDLHADASFSLTGKKSAGH